MDARQNYSIEELRQRSEAARADLADTVGALREKVSDTASELKTLVSPSHIKQEIKTYIRDERESLVHALERKVKENPLQAAAIGAAIAYPAWGLVRAIPTPLLLIGAGLWLTGSKGRSTMKQINATVTDAVEHGSAKATEYANTLKDSIAQRADAVARTVSEAGDAVARTVSEAGDAVSARAAAITDKARAAVPDLRDAHVLRSGPVAGTELAGNVAHAAARTWEDAKAGAAAAGQRSQSALMEFVDKNPLLVAGIGAAVGAFIAASIPPSDTENRVFGQPSDDLKDKARDAAAQGITKAKDLAADVADDVLTAAARAGLDGQGVQKAVETVTQGLKSVAERGVRTALGEPTLAPQLQPSQEN
jgi:ElaB/YqjD/DUF883 family membrane-anchored ribosome-binding protein